MAYTLTWVVRPTVMFCMVLNILAQYPSRIAEETHIAPLSGHFRAFLARLYNSNSLNKLEWYTGFENHVVNEADVAVWYTFNTHSTAHTYGDSTATRTATVRRHVRRQK